MFICPSKSANPYLLPAYLHCYINISTHIFDSLNMKSQWMDLLVLLLTMRRMNMV